METPNIVAPNAAPAMSEGDAAFRASLSKQDAAAFDADQKFFAEQKSHAGKETPPEKQVADAAATFEQNRQQHHTTVDDSGQGVGLSGAEIEICKKDIAMSSMSPEQKAAALKELEGGVVTAETKPQENVSVDPSEVAASPDQYAIPWDANSLTAEQQIEMQGMDATIRGAMSAAGLSRELGSSLAKTVNDIALATSRMSASELAMWQVRNRQIIAEKYGPSAVEKTERIRGMFAEVESKVPGIRAIIDRANAGNSPILFAILDGVLSRRKG